MPSSRVLVLDEQHQNATLIEARTRSEGLIVLTVTTSPIRRIDWMARRGLPPAKMSLMRVCVIRQGYFPFDPRVRREVAALVDDGHEVDVICLAEPGRPRRDRAAGANVHRIPLAHRRSSRVGRYLMQYLAFLVLSGGLAGVLHLRRRYDLVQVHSLPDTLVFAAVVPKLLGARVVLDLHEMMVEFFATKFGGRRGVLSPRLVARAERASIRFADFAFTCTNDMRDAFVRRGADQDKLGVVLNAAEEDVFDVEQYPPRGSGDGEFVLVSHGSIEERYGIDTLIRAVAVLRPELPRMRLSLFGEGSYAEEAKSLVRSLALEDHVSFSDGWVPLPELLDAIAGADAGVVAMKRDAFRDLTHCNKMYDLVTMRRPVVMSRTQSVENYFDVDCFEYFEAGDPKDLARAIRRLHDDPDRRAQLVERASQVIEPYRWPRQRDIYLAYIRQLRDD